MALDVKGVDGGAPWKAFPGRTRSFDRLSRAPAAASERFLNHIVLPSPALVPAVDFEVPGVCRGTSSSVTSSLGNEGVRPQELAHQFQRSVLISLWAGPQIAAPLSPSTARQR